jgi:hypothetical protein
VIIEVTELFIETLSDAVSSVLQLEEYLKAAD